MVTKAKRKKPDRKKLVPQAHSSGKTGAILQGGNWGNKGGGTLKAYRIRAQHLLERAQALERLADIIEGNVFDYVPVNRGKEGVDLVAVPAKVRDRILATERLEAAAGFSQRPQAPSAVAAAQFVILAPPKAKTTEEWLKMHQLGEA